MNHQFYFAFRARWLSNLANSLRLFVGLLEGSSISFRIREEKEDFLREDFFKEDLIKEDVIKDEFEGSLSWKEERREE